MAAKPRRGVPLPRPPIPADARDDRRLARRAPRRTALLVGSALLLSALADAPGAHAQGGATPASAPPAPASAVPGPDEAGLREALQRLTGRVDELSRQLQRQEQELGALAARPGPAAARDLPPAGPAPAPAPAASARAVAPRTPGPAAAPGSSLPALIVMVGGDASVTLQGRPVALPTIGFALQAAADGDASRRVVVGAEPGVSPARVGEVVGAVSQAGFGRITITGP